MVLGLVNTAPRYLRGVRVGEAVCAAQAAKTLLGRSAHALLSRSPVPSGVLSADQRLSAPEHQCRAGGWRLGQYSFAVLPLRLTCPGGRRRAADPGSCGSQRPVGAACPYVSLSQRLPFGMAWRYARRAGTMCGGITPTAAGPAADVDWLPHTFDVGGSPAPGWAGQEGHRRRRGCGRRPTPFPQAHLFELSTLAVAMNATKTACRPRPKLGC